MFFRGGTTFVKFLFSCIRTKALCSGEEQPKLYSCHHRHSSTLKVTLAREVKIQVYLSIDN